MSSSSYTCETVSDRSRNVMARPRRQQRPYATLIHGRERVRSVLEPHLGPTGALERANNIVQALVYEDTETAPVALEMLRTLPRELRTKLAAQVENAFRGEG
jgi:hypothetical protein